MRFEKNKRKKRLNRKVVATSMIAITLIGIVGLSIGNFFSKNTHILSSLSNPITFVEQNLNKGFLFLKSNVEYLINYRKNAEIVGEIQEENKNLKNQVVKLQGELDKIEDLENLKKTLNYIDEKYMNESLSASVVSKNDGNWYTSFTISAGSDDGVEKDSIVVNGNGLVGVVYEVSKKYSKVMSILDTRASVSFKIPSNSSFKGVLTQNATIDDMEIYKNKGYLYGYMFDTSYDVVPGNIIATSGLGIYPEDILVGEIDRVIDDKNQSMKYVIIKPYVDFKDIDEVMVIKPRDLGE